MIVKATAPGTCGEFIQGIYKREPCLVSAPVNCFSTVTIREGTGKNNLLPKTKELLKLFMMEFPETREKLIHSDILLSSDLPQLKGMASSTADLAALCSALGLYTDHILTDKEIAQFCILIEPTDNLMFHKLNLFGYYTGKVLLNLEKSLTKEILFIEFPESVDTIELGYEREFIKDESEFKEIVRLFSKGILENNLQLVGKACTESALLNQHYLYKSYLTTLIDLILKAKGLGLIIGHSGSVVGILYDQNFLEKEFLSSFKEKFKHEQYCRLKKYKLISGGVRLEMFI